MTQAERHAGGLSGGSRKRIDPHRDSNRTQQRATALTWTRGCETWNDCWYDCYDAALSAVLEDRLDEAERTWATTSMYWKLTHPGAPEPSRG